MLSAGIVSGIVVSQPAKVYPVFVGSAGFAIAVPNSCVIGAIAVSPVSANVIVYLLIVHFAVIVRFSAGIVVGTSTSHPAKV